jgi:microcystin-dependent protein
MSQPFIGEIRMFGGTFAPMNWMFCEGQVLPISEYSVLFNLIGTTYGGDGATTFNLPDLRGRLPMHVGTGFVIGQPGGTEQVTLNTQQIPLHSHVVGAKTAANGSSPSGAVYGGDSTSIYSTKAPSAPMNAAVVGANVGSQPHENRMPFLAVSFIICLEGVYPSQG